MLNTSISVLCAHQLSFKQHTSEINSMHKWFTLHRGFFQFILASKLKWNWVAKWWNTRHTRGGKNSPLRDLFVLASWLNFTWNFNRCQLMKFLWLSIGHRFADTNQYQLANFIDWYQFIDWISDHPFHRLVTPSIHMFCYTAISRNVVGKKHKTSQAHSER